MLIKVKIFPGSKKTEVIKKVSDSFKIRVKEKAERDLANKAVVRVLAEYFCMPRSSVRIISGHTSRQKIIEIIDKKVRK